MMNTVCTVSNSFCSSIGLECNFYLYLLFPNTVFEIDHFLKDLVAIFIL
jgi:hypothetical protein